MTSDKIAAWLYPDHEYEPTGWWQKHYSTAQNADEVHSFVWSYTGPDFCYAGTDPVKQQDADEACFKYLRGLIEAMNLLITSTKGCHTVQQLEVFGPGYYGEWKPIATSFNYNLASTEAIKWSYTNKPDALARAIGVKQ